MQILTLGPLKQNSLMKKVAKVSPVEYREKYDLIIGNPPMAKAQRTIQRFR